MLACERMNCHENYEDTRGVATSQMMMNMVHKAVDQNTFCLHITILVCTLISVSFLLILFGSKDYNFNALISCNLPCSVYHFALGHPNLSTGKTSQCCAAEMKL